MCKQQKKEGRHIQWAHTYPYAFGKRACNSKVKHIIWKNKTKGLAACIHVNAAIISVQYALLHAIYIYHCRAYRLCDSWIDYTSITIFLLANEKQVWHPSILWVWTLWLNIVTQRSVEYAHMAAPNKAYIPHILYIFHCKYHIISVYIVPRSYNICAKFYNQKKERGWVDISNYGKHLNRTRHRPKVCDGSCTPTKQISKYMNCLL